MPVSTLWLTLSTGFKVEIRSGGLDEQQVIDLLQYHMRDMLGISPKDSCHFLDMSALKGADVSFWSIWDGPRLAGMGALKTLDSRYGENHGEIKSMRAAPEYRGKGVGRLMLDHILDTARARGLTRLSLETGSSAPFLPAVNLYQRNGFQPCGPFADYKGDDPFSLYMTRLL